VILVDNGSQDDSLRTARRLFPTIKIIALPENRGFAVANNLGFEQASSELILVLNNDTFSSPEFLGELYAAACANPQCGMVAPKILNFSDRRIIDSVGGLLFCRDGIAQGRGRGEVDHGQYDQLTEILGPSACAALYRRTMLQEIGGFAESFFAYCEDSELALRAAWAGWAAISAPGAVVYHKYSATFGKYSPRKLYLVERNHFLLAMRTFPMLMLATVPVWSAGRYVLMACVAITRRGKGAALSETGMAPLVSALLRGQIAALRSLLFHMWERPKVRRRRGHDISKLLRQHRLSIRKMIADG
jgi:GT2 family glycosyltransferase